MRIAVFLPLLLPLLADRGAMPLAHQLPPRLATWAANRSRGGARGVQYGRAGPPRRHHGAWHAAARGRPGRVVVSTAVLDALSPAELNALIAHERSHLAHHHYLFLAAAHPAAALNPLLRPVARAVGYTVERWADEDAAHAPCDRPVVAHAVGWAALADHASPDTTPAADPHLR